MAERLEFEVQLESGMISHVVFCGNTVGREGWSMLCSFSLLYPVWSLVLI